MEGHEHIVLSHPAPTLDGPTNLVRIHSECLTGDVFGSYRCDCGEQLHAALQQIAAEGGHLVYVRGHEGRGIGLFNKLRTYALQETGVDTLDANLHLGFPADAREYFAVAAILKHLGIDEIRLLTNNPDKQAQLIQAGVHVTELVPSRTPRAAKTKATCAPNSSASATTCNCRTLKPASNPAANQDFQGEPHEQTRSPEQRRR